MECLECQFVNPEDFKFCGRCGHPFEPQADKTAPPLESERKHVTIMFSDLSGYTAMTERFDPEEVKEIMSLIFGKITEIIKSYDGFIERFIGDAVMAVFGVPQAHEDDPIRAIRAALKIHAAVESFSPQFEEKIGCSLTMHTGINTGLVVTGEVDVQKGTHGLTGDAINLASRLEGIAKAGEIIVGPDTFKQTLNYFEFETLAPIIVKGKQQPINTYKVWSVKKKSFKTHRLQGLQAVLTGRDQEMAILAESIERLKQGHGSIISISGDAGTGKSRLKKEFKDSLDLNVIQWREGRAYGYTQNMPYYPLIDLLTYAFQIEESDPPEKIRRKLEAGVDYLLGEDNKNTPYIGSLFALSYKEIEGVSPEYWKEKLGESIQAILSALVDRKPTVVCFEDLHWTDPSFIELFKKLIVNTHQKVLFICTYRSHFTLFDSDPPDKLRDRYQNIHLKDLAELEAQEMLTSLLGTQNMPAELKEAMGQKGEGNPFYIEEIINSLIESEILARDNGNWKLSRKITETDIPATIHGVLTARVDRLGKEFKRILQEASVIGRFFLYKILEKISNVGSDLEHYLSSLESLDLIRTQSMEPELEYIFKHALIQEVVYNGLLKSERIVIHERIGFVIEQLFQDRLPEFYETLAYHFKQSQLDRKAVEYLIRSGEKSLKRYAVEESHRYYNEAFNILANMPIESEEDKPLLVDILVKWSLVHYFSGDFIHLWELLSSQKDIADSITDKSKKGMYYAWFGFILYVRDKYNDAYEYLMKALKLGEEVNNKMLEGYASTWLVYLCGDLGLFDDSIRFSERALTIAQTEKTDPYLFFKSLGGIAQTCFYTGNAPKASEAGAVLLKFGKQQANVRGMVMGHIGLGISDMIVGKFYNSIEHLKNAIEVSADPFYRQVGNYVLGAAYVLSEDFSNAEVVLQEVIAYASEYGCEWAGTPATMFYGVVQIVSGKMTLGLRKINSSLEQFKKEGRKPYIALTEYILGKIYYMMANPKDPIGITTIIKNLFFILKNRPYAIKKAENHFNCAILLAKEIGAKSILAQTYLDMGFLKRKQLKMAEAIKLFSLAASLFEEFKAEVYVKQARDALEDLDR